MNLSNVKPGLVVRTAARLGSTAALLVVPRHLTARTTRYRGVVTGWIAGHGGDCWWVDHGEGAIGAYSFTEFEPIPRWREVARAAFLSTAIAAYVAVVMWFLLTAIQAIP